MRYHQCKTKQVLIVALVNQLVGILKADKSVIHELTISTATTYTKAKEIEDAKVEAHYNGNGVLTTKLILANYRMGDKEVVAMVNRNDVNPAGAKITLHLAQFGRSLGGTVNITVHTSHLIIVKLLRLSLFSDLLRKFQVQDFLYF